MKAVYRVKNSQGQSVGYVLDDGEFYNQTYVQNNIRNIDNLTLLKSGILRSKKGILPEIKLRQYNNIKYQQLVKRNPFKRDIEDKFIQWMESKEPKVLRVNGPRQVGKTTEILKFGYKYYEQVIYVNLQTDKNRFLNTVINNQATSLQMVQYCDDRNMARYINDRSTVLIIDEIQISPEVYNSIRALNQKLNCDIVVTGSYLGRIFNGEFFHPAGTIQTLTMRQLQFKEFCRIFGVENKLQSISLFGLSNQEDYDTLHSLYDVYKQIGGYPDVIKTYIETGDIQECIETIKSLMEIFKEESLTYFRNPREVAIFDEVYRVTAQMMCSDKKGTGNKILSNISQIVGNRTKTLVSREEVGKAISWLYQCGILGTCDLVNNGDIRDIQSDRRIYFTDCGIANYALTMSGYSAQNIIGVLTENSVYCEICQLYDYHKSLIGKKPYFQVYGDYELDFMLIDKIDGVLGIEVKSKTGTHKSLDVYLSKKFINRGILAKDTRGGHSQKFDTVPIFTIGCRYPYND